MKAFTFTLLMIFIMNLSQGQDTIYYNETPFNTYNEKYLECYFRYNYSVTKYNIVIIDPKKKDFFEPRPRVYLSTSQNGERLTFNSRLEALNFLYKHNWELVHVYTDGEGKITKYLMGNTKL